MFSRQTTGPKPGCWRHRRARWPRSKQLVFDSPRRGGNPPHLFRGWGPQAHSVPARASHLSDWPQACSRQCGRAPLATRSGACSRRASATWRRPTCSRLTRTSPTPPFGRRTIWARGRTVRCSLRRLRRAPPAARGISRGGGQRARLPQPRRQDGHAARVPVAHAYVAHLQAAAGQPAEVAAAAWRRAAATALAAADTGPRRARRGSSDAAAPPVPAQPSGHASRRAAGPFSVGGAAAVRRHAEPGGARARVQVQGRHPRAPSRPRPRPLRRGAGRSCTRRRRLEPRPCA